jgi:signal transduction histidine kinase
MHTLVALFVFVIGLGATLYYWRNLNQSVQSEYNAAFTRQAQDITQAMTMRIEQYDYLLRGSAGLFAIHDSMTQEDWNKYHVAYNMRESFPAIEGIGVNRYLKNSEVPAYLEHKASLGEPLQIFPAGDRETYAPIIFDAPYTGNKGGNRGYDAFSDPVRRKAMEQSVSTGLVTMSGKLKLVSEARPNRSSFIVCLPVYHRDMPTTTKEERWAAVAGFAYIAVDHATFANAILTNNQNPHVGIKMADADLPAASAVGYESANFADIKAKAGAKIETIPTEFFGHTWNMTLATSADLLSPRERQLPEQALWRGLITCIFFAGLVWYLITDRERKYARQKQEEVQTAKDDLLSLASHQLRTPATVVKQYVGMLLQGYAGKLSERQVGMLNTAYDSNERQLEIINQLLYVARLDAGRITLHTKALDLNKMMREVVSDQKEALTIRKQRLNVKLPGRPLTIEADPHYLRMVLENLLSNAIKYTPEGGAIVLEARKVLQEVSIRVKDSGVGVDPAVQELIFEKFTRVENELSTDVNGSGVGLYLTRQIVELHGGEITVKSQAGKGATFALQLPIKQPKPDERAGERPLS